MDDRARRLAENERLFREVNERIERAAAGHGDDAHEYEFLCECSNLDCDLMLPLRLADYERARAEPVLFIVAYGHELPEIESVVDRADGYQLVRKHGEAARVAEEEDPRRR
ncbi:MAG: hypothetical protein ACRDL2_04950 [Gaiellaceae bacterium]